MPLTLYWNLGSQPARAVKCLLDIGEIECNLITLDVVKNETRTKEYLNINPLGQIPFLVDGNIKVAQSNAILVYLCEKYADKLGKYYGTTIQQRALVNQSLSWYQNYFRPALFKLIFLKIYEGLKKQKPVYHDEILLADKQMTLAMKQLEKQLQLFKSNFIVGNKLTIADLQFFFEITNYKIYNKSFDNFQLITNWYNRVLQVQEVKLIQEQWGKIAPGITSALKSVPLVQKSKL